MELLFINEGGVMDAVETNGATPITPAQNELVEEVVVDGQTTAAEAEAAPAGSGMGLWIMIIVMIAIMYFFMWRPESKRRKQMQKFREGLKKGDKIITAGGIYGVIKEVHETTVLIEVDGNVTLRVDKGMVVGDPSNGIMNK